MKFLIASTFALVLSAQVAADKPILRVETGMHTASIRRAAVDARERFVVTASWDKTARVWDLASGRLLSVLRPPIGNGSEGKFYSVAISPDGSTVACGGFTSPVGQSESIYIFDRVSGRMIRRIANLPNVVNQLTYSPNGQFLAANIGGDTGVRLFRTSDYSLAGQDGPYTSESYGADFFEDRSGRLLFVSTSHNDGIIRLYSVAPTGALTLLSKSVPAPGNRPLGVQFSPDGSRVAIGFLNAPNLRILSVPALTDAQSPDTRSLPGFFAAVAWSADGSVLAGGSYGNPRAVVRWTQGGRGAPTVWPISSDAVTHIAPLRSGRILYATSDPSWGLLDSSGRKVFESKSGIVDLSTLRDIFASSDQGDTVRFAYESWGKAPVAFSATQRSLAENPAPAALRGPDTKSLPITDWYEAVPTFNGRKLTLESFELSRGVAIAPGGQRVVFGTDWYLRCYDRTGTELWKLSAPAVSSAVTIPPSGKVVLAAYRDGTIHWYRLTDGKELLTFFPHNDRKRWVLWTPAGYYDASPGGEDLIGWQVNNGRDAAADFFPASRFRSIYYRPDVVSRVLSSLDESEALRLADSELNQRRRDVDIARMTPPVVRILSPNEGTTVSTPEVTLRYQVRSTSGEPITGVRVLVDGRPVETPRAFSPVVGDSREVRVNIPKKDCEISLIAENRFAASEPAMLRLKWQGAQEQFSIKPKLYVLSIGINYADPYRLTYPAKDAQDFVRTLEGQKGLLYREVNARLLTNNKATKEEILDGLDWIEKNTTQHDVAMVYLAGHGVNDTNGIYYYLPMGFDAERLKRTAVAFSDIRNTVQSMAGKVVFFVDTCHSGNVLGARTRSMASDVNAFVNELSSAENGAVVFAASTGRQLALERDEWGNGAFTKALLEGLSGKADFQSTGKITVNMLDLYVSERVKQLTGGRQTPATTKPKTISDFPVAVRQ